MAVALPFAGAGMAQATTVALTPLTLLNGWTNAPFSTSNAAVPTVCARGQLKGAIATTGTNPVPFTLPAAFRPATAVYVKVDLCGATNGRLFIQRNGTVTVIAEGAFFNAQCFTSLDGASFAKSATSYTSLTLQNGRTNAPFSTSNAAARPINGGVHLRGALATPRTNPVSSSRPSAL